ncbi:hypothetical protein BU9_CDS0016 [Klebsiella phage Kpn BU9]|nr:hypothetical protein BU9_CDS0016 [Klebsiella phage Kpn BU9]DAV78057.1 MAG TPA: hypothetical protein [Caudoviricetes sp.]
MSTTYFKSLITLKIIDSMVFSYNFLIPPSLPCFSLPV